MTFFKNLQNFYAKYAFLIIWWRNIMGFLRPKYFFFKRVFFSLSNEV